MASGYYDRMQQWLPPPTEPLPKGLRVFWIDLMRIIGCIAVPIVHAINFTGTPGQPDPKHLGAFHCGYNARDPSQLHGRHYTPDTHSPESIRLEQYLERRYMSSMAIFFFASGAALYYSLMRVPRDKFWSSLWSRNAYLMALLAFGMLTCVVPVNMIWHGAATVREALFGVNPFYHLGFLITLALFTLLVTPFCWAICRASVAGWIIWGSFMIALIVVLLTLAQTTRLQLSPELLPMTLLNNANLAWVIVSSYSDSLREFRAPVATLVHIWTFAVPEHFKAIWHEREGGPGNAITTLYLVMMLYLLPFVLGMLGEAFPNRRTPTRAYVKYHAAILLYMVFSYWTEPVGSAGWMEAYSIRMFDGRGDRMMYLANMWATVWFLFEALRVYDDCPFPTVIKRLNTYSLLLYVYHPLFLALTSCWVVAYIASIPCLLETAMLYTSAIVGCAGLWWALFIGWPRASKRLSGQRGRDDSERAPLLAEERAPA